MGQLVQKGSLPQLPIQIPQDNVIPFNKKSHFIVCPFLEFYACQRIFFIQNQDEVQALYKFGSFYTVHLQLKKQSIKRVPGIYMKMADEYVYAYKHRKLDRSDKIKPQKLLFKKRMHAYEVHLQLNNEFHHSQQNTVLNALKQRLLTKFAQIKLFSLLQLGPKLGRVYNGCDGIITSEYIQYFSEITIDRIQNCIAKNSQLKQLQKKLVSVQVFEQGLLRNQNLSYSRWKKGYVLRQVHYYQNSIKSVNQMSHQNQSIHYIVRMFQTQVTKAIMDLDNQAKMLPFINNLIFQHDFQKAISKLQETLPMIQDEDEKLEYAQEITSMIQKHTTSNNKQYQRRIQKIVSASSNKQSLAGSIDPSTAQKNNSAIVSLNTSIRENLLPSNKKESFFHENLGFMSPLSEDNLPTDNLQSYSQNKNDTIKQGQDQIISQFKLDTKTKLQQIQMTQKQNMRMFTVFCKSLRTFILDKNNKKVYQTLIQMQEMKWKTNIQIQIIFGKTLMQNGRSRHALAIFQRLLYFSNEASACQVYQYYEIALLAGIIYYHRYSYGKSMKAFQKALSILVRLRHYSIKMMAINNNLSCVYHVLRNYDQSMLHLHRGFKLGQYSVDYEYLMRSNMAMSLAEKGRTKQAKAEMMKTNKIVQPLNNMVIFCKFYSNLAYLQLLEAAENKGFDKTISNFQQACNIEQKYLIPNGYKPSIFLHNNMAMLHYKRKQFKKAKFHSQKIVDQLNDLRGIVAVKVHFNIGKILSQGYNYDLPLKHFHEARTLLNKLHDNIQPQIRKYRETINKEIQELQKMRIDEVSEQQSYKFSYMSSSLLKKI